MDDEKRKKILITAIILFVLMGVLFLVMKLSNKNVSDDLPLAQNTVDDQPVFDPRSINIEYNDVQIVEKEVLESNVEFTVLNLAKSYSSRLGSWSTDNRGKNLQELLPLSTVSMKKYLNSRDLGPEEGGYIGVTTKSLSAKLLSISDDEAEVLVSTQRIETDESLIDNIVYQDIKLSLSNHNDEWLVDEAYWQ